jgi:aquaporin Z
MNQANHRGADPADDVLARQRASLRPATPAHAPQAGWHWIPWLCEYLGTALLLAGGLSAVFLDFGPHSPLAQVLPSSSARLLLTGLLFAGTGSLVALSPIGRRSGAHLNPAVTLAFWTQRKVHPHDLAGYITAQFLGAITACALLRLSWGHTAQVLHVGATQPGHGFSNSAAAALETAMTASLVLMILLMTSSTRTARWTPLGNWLLVATLVWQGAPYTGTSLNPARSLGPALVAPLLSNLWPYLAGPLAGALVAAAIFAFFPRWNTLTAKLFHDPRYHSTLGSDLPTATTGHDPAPGSTS